MSYFISVPDTMQEFDGIREAQLLEIIKQGWAAPHDKRGYQLTAETFHARIRQQTESEVHRLQDELVTSLHSEIGWGGESFHNRQMRLTYQGYIDAAEEYTPSEVLHSMSFVRKELERAIQEHYPDVFEAHQESTNQIVLQTVIDTQQHIQSWEAILPELAGTEPIAARLAIAKWKGKSHPEAFQDVRPGENTELAKRYVSEKRKIAEKIAEKYSLTMPPWRSE